MVETRQSLVARLNGFLTMLVKHIINVCQIRLFIALLSCQFATGEPYQAYSISYPNNVYWGDTHVHTRNTIDSVFFGGNHKLSPADAYRFARGDAITIDDREAKLRRPLDFLVVADHAVNMGVIVMTDAGKKMVNDWQQMSGNKIGEGLAAATKKSVSNKQGSFLGRIWQEDIVKDINTKEFIWHKVTADADAFNNPNKFTTFIGYEWTSWGASPAGGQLHRVVIFEDDASKANQILPFTSYDSKKPEDLWQFFETYKQKTGGDILAIPHNPNLSKGSAFAIVDTEGRPLTQAYARTRARWEPLLEVTQTKGDSESHPVLSPDDEFSDYEVWNGFPLKENSELNADEKNNKVYEYARSALKLGLNQQAALGVNPFKFGMIGSTDSHTSLATADEDNFWGKFSSGGPASQRLFGYQGNIRSTLYGASGYAAVWARENTRKSLFAAMKRKETYATTGPRMVVRFFGGWDFQPDDALRPNLPEIGYSKGVPMGGDLTQSPNKDAAPSFLIRAVKDPDGANLDRVQVIKGWRSEQGKLHEKIYNVALSGSRKENPDGHAPHVGNSVDIQDASYTNSIGAPELATVWADPDFNQAEHAFYYLRVIEIPTPRWPAYDAKFLGVKELPHDTKVLTQERAYTSPIWYTP